MSPAMPFDEATSRRVEAAYRTPCVARQRRAVLAALGLKAGEDVLDIGSGPGFLACDMGREVGPDGSVTGVDPSQDMLSIARARPAQAQRHHRRRHRVLGERSRRARPRVLLQPQPLAVPGGQEVGPRR